MRHLIVLLLLLGSASANADLLSGAFEKQLVQTLRQVDRDAGTGQVSPSVGRLFIDVSDTLQAKNGSERAARRTLGCFSGSCKTSRKPDQLEQALVFALRLHNNQRRKGTDVPYLSHLLGVAGRVIAATHDRQLAVAALLHDAVEDQGGEKTLAKISRLFGRQTARRVAQCSEPEGAPWLVRKQQTINKIANRRISRGALVIKLADSDHNSTTMVDESARCGAPFWQRFNGGKAGTLWCYRQKVRAFERAGLGSSALLGSLRRNVQALQRPTRQSRRLSNR